MASLFWHSKRGASAYTLYPFTEHWHTAPLGSEMETELAAYGKNKITYDIDHGPESSNPDSLDIWGRMPTTFIW